MLPIFRALALATVLAAAIASLGPACDNPVDSSVNKLPGLAGGGDTDAADTSAEAIGTGDCDCLVPGLWFRFELLGLTSIDGGDHPVIGTLNPLWKGDIDKNELNIFFEIVRVEADEVEMRAASGARLQDGTNPCVLDGTDVQVVFPRDGCMLDLSEFTGLNVYAGTPKNPKNCATSLSPNHAIQARQARLSGRVTDSCDGVVDGLISEGVLGRDELVATCTCLVLGDDPAEKCGDLDPAYGTSPDDSEDAKLCPGCNGTYVNLETLMQAFGEVKFDSKLADGRAATKITGFFEAQQMDATPPICPAP